MGSYANKTQDKNWNTVDSAAKQQGGSATLQFVNNRPEAAAQRSLQVAADNSAQVKQLEAIKQLANPAPEGLPVAQLRRTLPHRRETSLNDNTRLNAKRIRHDAGAMTRWDILDHSLLGGAASTAGAGKADAMMSKNSTPEGATVLPREVSAFAGASGAFGVATDLRSGYKTGREALDDANSKSARRQAFGETMGSLGSATKGAATSIINFSEYANAGFTGAATTTASIASVATGAADIVTGSYGAWKAHKRQKELKNIRDNQRTSPDIKLAAEIGAASQGREKIKGYGKVFKGVAGVIGGAMILAGAATPFGWLALTVGAGIAATAAAINYVKKRNNRQEMAAAVLGVRDDWKDWNQKIKENRYKNWRHPMKWWSEADQLGPDPLKEALRQGGYKNAAHAVNNYARTVSVRLHEGLRGGSKETIFLLKNLGFNVDRNKMGKAHLITPEKIARKLLV
ncbi:hypothetical protein [Mucilaginibacter sp.]|uniref:hypothetical protein n=1 Tax=Mucilaginibacter sp. TaxID=1882438 RepID=UPI002616CD3E|nr:hypothetical protein [Mucilaginibacter sp.]